MTIEALVDEAESNMSTLRNNPYPGRGIVVGVDESSKYLVQVYWIMGRSANSRNRVFKDDMQRVFTEPADATKVEDPSLIIYNAMDVHVEEPWIFVVSNGNQTDKVTRGETSFGLEGGLYDSEYEPDKPNFTPRITAVSCTAPHARYVASIGVLRKSPYSVACERLFFHYETIHPGFGYCVTTYQGDGNPLPPFRGEPLLMRIHGAPKQVAQNFWDALDSENRVSLVVKFIKRDSRNTLLHIINKYEQVGQ
jgi:IMP cyclohydrolase